MASPQAEALRGELATREGTEKLPLLAELLRLSRGERVLETESYVNASLVLLDQFPNFEVEAEFLNDLSWALSTGGNAEKGLAVAERAHSLAQSRRDKPQVAWSEYHLSLAMWYLSRGDEALTHGELALALHKSLNALDAVATVHTLLGAIHRSRSDFDAALQQHTLARDAAVKIGSANSEARANNNIGLILWQLDDPELAKSAMQPALNYYRDHGPSTKYASALSNFGLMHIELDEPQLALRYLDEALGIHDVIDMPRGKARLLSNMAYAHERLGEDNPALRFHHAALELRQAMNDDWGQSRTLGSMAGVYHRQGDLDQAELHFLDALARARDADALSEQAEIHAGLAKLYEEQGRLADALAALRENHALSSEINREDAKRGLAAMASEREIAVKELELARQSKRQTLLLLTSCILVILALGLFLFGRSRTQLLQNVRASHRELELATVSLRESEQRYRGVFNDAVVPKFMIEIDTGRVLDANDPAATLCGLSIDALRRRNAADLQPDWLKNVASHYAQLPDGELRVDRDWQTPEGQDRHAQVWLTPMVSEGQACALVTVHDDTEDRRLEEDRTRIDKLESLGVLAGGIAHDFNNALTAILGHITRARFDLGADSNVAATLAEAEKAVDQSVHLTSNLLAFAKGGMPKRELHDISAQLPEVVQFALSGSSVSAKLDIADDLWTAEVDLGQFRQLISNLVMNGEQAMDGLGQLRVRAHNHLALKPISPEAPAGDYLLIEVTDKGSGIAPEIQNRVLDPYFTTKPNGSGLGLASAFAIATRHGGWLDFSSQLKHGTTFRLYIPAKQMALSDSVRDTQEDMRGNEYVLVMDDDRALQKMYRAALERLGYEVVITQDGAEALKCYEQALADGRKFDLVIMDLTVPGGMGGKAAMQALRELDPDVLGVVASGYSNDSVMSNFQQAGFAAALSKPFGLSKLAKLVREVLDAGHRD